MAESFHQQYMARAIQLAEKPHMSPHPNPRVGCVIVKNGKVVGEGFHAYAGGPHAEVNALAMAGDQAFGSDVYVSLEPCCFHGRTPPCVEALLKAQVSKVIVGMLDPNPKVAGKGVSLLQQAGVTVVSEVLAEQAAELNKGFIQRMTLGRPWVRCKMAMSLDGRTALANGESQWITGAAARQDVQRYRARSDAILTGIGTVLSDNPRMTIRSHKVKRQPMRIIVDSELRLSPEKQIVKEPGDVLLATLVDDEKAYPENVTVKQFPAGETGIDLLALMKFLGEQEINEVQVEAGATLCGALLQAQLIDELVLYMVSTLLGDSARGLFALPELTAMQDKISLHCLDLRRVGEDFRFIMQPLYEA
ncbi:MAG TPA: bifunctional diaminohydroxyphosphoribosylaminopyrimidine deaminase/5-amino-6-(5-phosphoribosylamino)uracil reductase RibD [Gammaproteobacteria bacterium]|nr:bifunctional diaminohydroxyphosphoribosylaminopyrimidine deaminase/5-amino-6-(5-phosphoribosylamino)uracil reductase RibD [Gammaproteobacteria bacterium]